MIDTSSHDEASAGKWDRRTTPVVDTWTLTGDRPAGWSVLDEVPTRAELAADERG